jgi:hypothetical protein
MSCVISEQMVPAPSQDGSMWLHVGELESHFVTRNGARLPLLREVPEQNGEEVFHLLLDQSESMFEINQVVFESAREIIDDLPPTARVIASSFNSTVHIGDLGTKESASRTLSQFQPRGSTRLNDAILDAIRVTPDIRTSKYTLLVLTDGVDASSTSTKADVRTALSAWQTQSHNRLIFLGSDQDAVLAAEQLGIPRARALSVRGGAEQTRSAFRSVCHNHRAAVDGFTATQRGSAASGLSIPPARAPPARRWSVSVLWRLLRRITVFFSRHTNNLLVRL